MMQSFGSLLDALRGVTWPARRPAPGATAGTHRSRLRGASPEFTEYRPYRQGDDSRRLDWRLLARTDRAFLRVTRDRSTLGTMLLLDASASMDYPVATREKWEQACRLAVGLAAVAHAAGDPVGVLVPTANGAVVLAPRSRRGVLAEIARVLRAVTPGGSAPLAPALRHLRAGDRVAVISDFLGDADALFRAAAECARSGSEVAAVHVVAPDERDGPRDAILATDPEAPALRRPLVDATRDAYRDAFAAWRGELARAWRGVGATFVEVASDESTAAAVRRIVRPAAGVRAEVPR